MNKDAVFRGSPERACDFEFNAEIAEVFDDMLVRSAPFYLEQQNMLQRVCSKIPGPRRDGLRPGLLDCHDPARLMRHVAGFSSSHYGYDNSRPMSEQARRKITRESA